MKTPPLHLADYFFTKIQVEPKVGKVGKADVFPLQTRVNFSKGKEESDLVIHLGVRKGADALDEKGTYSFEIEVCGFFSADKALFAKDADKAMSFVRVNGTSMLLGTVRELVLQLTSRGPFRSFMIPALSFVDLAEAPASRQK